MGLKRRLSYKHVGTFKGILFLAAIILIISMLVYTQYVISQLRGATRRSLTQKIQNYSVLVRSDNPELIALALQQIQTVDFPIIVTDSLRNPKTWKNVGVEPGDTSSIALEKLHVLLEEMNSQGNEPLAVQVSETQIDWFHYGDTEIIRQIRWLPWIEIAAAALFIVVGYMGFRNIKRSEERMVWVGLAKETAHQLGTPLTSLMGWIELMRAENGNNQALAEMDRDIHRLEKVTARFSQIGSEAILTSNKVSEVVHETTDYFRKRLPRTGKPIEITEKFICDPYVMLNAQLFSWVLENLIKNSIDALRVTGGQIKITCEEKSGWLQIDVIDNGQGIPMKDRRNVFRPGFSTKTRGWGLGLSLAKRIVEEYHGGKLYIKESIPGKSTVIRIALKTIDHAVQK